MLVNQKHATWSVFGGKNSSVKKGRSPLWLAILSASLMASLRSVVYESKSVQASQRPRPGACAEMTERCAMRRDASSKIMGANLISGFPGSLGASRETSHRRQRATTVILPCPLTPPSPAFQPSSVPPAYLPRVLINSSQTWLHSHPSPQTSLHHRSSAARLSCSETKASERRV